MSSLCTKIMRVCEKSTYITFVNHCWIVGSSWRQYLNQLFEIISALNINDWHARGLCLAQTTNDMNCMTLDKNLHHDQAFANSSTISLHSNIIHLNGVETQKTKNNWHSPGWPGSAVLPENSWGKKGSKMTKEIRGVSQSGRGMYAHFSIGQKLTPSLRKLYARISQEWNQTPGPCMCHSYTLTPATVF